MAPIFDDHTPWLRRHQRLGFSHSQLQAGSRFLFVLLDHRAPFISPVRSLSPQLFPLPTCLSPLLGGSFSLPCCLSSHPPPSAGPFRRQQMGTNVTLAISLSMLCPGPAERSSWSCSRWGLTEGQNVGVGCRGHSPPLTTSGQPPMSCSLWLLPPSVPFWL